MSVKRARSLRRRMPPAEARLWKLLRDDPFKSHHFRRQVPLGPFYADFASHGARLVIEVDGSGHFVEGEQQYDERRTRFIQRQGYRVVRFTTLDVMNNLEGVYAQLQDLCPHPPAVAP